MSDFCFESLAVHPEYVREYNKNVVQICDTIDAPFYCVTTHPEEVIKRDNIFPVHINEYTDQNFSKSYDTQDGFGPILHATRFGIKHAYKSGFKKIVHLHTDFVLCKKDIDTQMVSEHFKPGIYFDMGGCLINSVYQRCQKTKFLCKKYNLTTVLEKIGTGDDPVVFFNFDKGDESFDSFYNHLEEMINIWLENDHWSTGLCTELTLSTYLAGYRSYYNYTGVAHDKLNEKFFDVQHNHLHVQYYSDADEKMYDSGRVINEQNI